MVAKSGEALLFEDVVVRYTAGERAAVDGVSLEIPGGSFTVLLGPSGCGKSTLLRTVNRLVLPTSGAVSIDGVDIATLDPVTLRRSIGYVIQAVGLFTHMTVAQNIGIVPALLGWDRTRVKQRVDELLELVHLNPSEYRLRYPRELSGGEAQRAGVARAIAAEPGVLLMDEPFGAVDAIVRTSLQQEIRSIVDRLQTTVLFVTHDVDEALLLADRIAVMRDGKVVQSDTPHGILNNPADGFVERLFSMNPKLQKYEALRARLQER